MLTNIHEPQSEYDCFGRNQTDPTSENENVAALADLL